MEDERVDPGASAIAIGEELGGKRVLDPVHQPGMRRVEGNVRRLVDPALQIAGKVPEEARRPAVSHPDRLPRRRAVDTLRLEDGVVDHPEEGQPFRPPDLLGVGRPPVRLPDPRPEPSALLAARLRLAGGGGVEEPERLVSPRRNREERVDPGERVAGQVREDRRPPPLPCRRREAPAPSSTGAGRAPPCRSPPFSPAANAAIASSWRSCPVQAVGEPEERLLPDRIVPGTPETPERFRRSREIPLILGDPRREVPRPFRRPGEGAPLRDLQEFLARLREPPRLPFHARPKEADLRPERRRGVRQMLFQKRGGRRGLPLLPVELGVVQDQREIFSGGRETEDRLFEERPRPFRFPGPGGRLGELRVEARRQVPSREEAVGTPLPQALEGEDPGLLRRIGREILQVERCRFRRGARLTGEERGDISFLRLSSAPAHLPAGEAERFAGRGDVVVEGGRVGDVVAGDTGAGGSRGTSP